MRMHPCGGVESPWVGLGQLCGLKTARLGGTRKDHPEYPSLLGTFKHL